MDMFAHPLFYENASINFLRICDYCKEAKTQKPKAKSQWPKAAFFAHHGHLSGGDVLRKNGLLF
jgi:hypothetical protein